MVQVSHKRVLQLVLLKEGLRGGWVTWKESGVHDQDECEPHRREEAQQQESVAGSAQGDYCHI